MAIRVSTVDASEVKKMPVIEMLFDRKARRPRVKRLYKCGCLADGKLVSNRRR